MLTCQELVELVTDYLEGTLPESERAAFEEHVSHCRGCSAYLEQMRKTVYLTGRLTEDELNPSVRDKFLAVFRHWKGSK